MQGNTNNELDIKGKDAKNKKDQKGGKNQAKNGKKKEGGCSNQWLLIF